MTNPTQNSASVAAAEIIDRVLAANAGKSSVITCSFQVEDMVVLHVLRQRIADIPVVFLETGYHFSEMYEYRDRITKSWGLNLTNAAAERSVTEQESAFGTLYHTDPGRCCHLRKVEPLMSVLKSYDIWFTGLRREQSPTRRNLQVTENHELPTGKVLLKVSPLAMWDWKQVWDYIVERGIEHMPLYDRGYRSIGCEPCTSIPSPDADPRSGRWGGAKLECGIHTFSKRAD